MPFLLCKAYTHHMWCHLGSDGALLELQDETAESGR
jgi:hypothetical protein